MTLAVTQFGEGKDIVLLHGWRANRTLWEDWAKETFADYRVTLIDFPGHGDSSSLPIIDDKETLSRWQDALLAVMPDKAIVLGWSLGGLLAQSIAISHPERVAALILLASNPCFVQRDDWLPALARPLFAQYLHEIVHNAAQLFKSFFMLESMGSPEPKKLYKQLVSLLSPVSTDLSGMRQGLYLLEQVDFREQLHSLTIPCLWLLAENDAIVPVALAQELNLLQPNAVIRILQNCGHLPFLTIPQLTSQHIQLFLEERLS